MRCDFLPEKKVKFEVKTFSTNEKKNNDYTWWVHS